MTATVVLIIYFLWAFLPDEVLQDLGVSYFPIKYWALALPTYLLLSTWIGVFAYSASFFYLAPPLDAPLLIQDSYTLTQHKNDGNFAIRNAQDLDLAKVNRMMLGPLVCQTLS
jgi:phosphatidylinositol glycan class P protein